MSDTLPTLDRLAETARQAIAAMACSAPVAEYGSDDDVFDAYLTAYEAADAFRTLASPAVILSLVTELASLRALVRAGDEDREAKPYSEWHEDCGPALWWRVPVESPPYAGSPHDSEWPFWSLEEAALWWTPLEAIAIGRPRRRRDPMSTETTPTELTQDQQEKPSDEAPWPKTEAELVAFIREMAAWPSGAADSGVGYGRCVYAMSYAAVATFRYLASMLGVTGFQASCADLDILKQLRGYQHGFMVLDANNLLYPQYDLQAKVATWIEETRPRLADAAKALLAASGGAHPDVRARWEEIASLEAPANAD